VQRLGFIAVFQSELIARIVMNRKMATDRAVSTLLVWGAEANLSHVVVSYHGRKCSHRVIHGIEGLRRAVLEIFQGKDRNIADRFLSRRLKPNQVSQHQALGTLHGLWSQGKQQSVGSLTDFCNDHLKGRFTVLAKQNAQWRIASVGGGYTIYPSSYINASVGTALEDDPDPAYGGWLATSYKVIDQDGQPGLEDVDAIIKTPAMGCMRHLRYRRLVVPFESQAGGQLLVTTSVLDASINLRDPGL
jgi:hypothetical protein